jgi:hydroxyacylglutathione hydrolase
VTEPDTVPNRRGRAGHRTFESRIAEVPKDRRVVIQCAGGYRSSIAASLLLKHGRTNVEDLIGGMGAWEKAHQPVAR